LLYALRYHLFSDMAEHSFCRYMDDATIVCSAANTVAFLTSAGTAPGWLTVGALATDVVGSTSQFGFSITSFLSNVPGASEFTNLFERFQILKMEVEIKPVMGDSWNPNVGCLLPMFTSVLDFNDAAPPANFQVAQQYESAQEYQATQDRSFKRSCRPKVAQAVYLPGAGVLGFASNQNTNDIWVDSANPNAPHYGMKFFVRNFFTGAATAMGIRVQPKLWFKFRETH